MQHFMGDVAMLRFIVLVCLSFMTTGYATLQGCHVKDLPVVQVLYKGRKNVTIGHGQKLNLTCKPEYHEMTVTTECINSRFTRPQPRCKLVKCPDYGELAHGKREYGGNRGVKTFAITSCDPDYVYTGDSKRVCQRSGHWTGENGTCISKSSVKCKQPNISKHMLLAPLNHTYAYGSKVSVRCEKGYSYNGPPPVIECMVNKSWSELLQECHIVNCVEPSLKISHGQLTSCNPCVYGTRLDVVCEEGYFHDGTSLQCDHDGKWNGTSVSCLKAICQGPHSVTGGRVQPDGYKPGDSARLLCQDGYDIEGPSVMICQKDGRWNNTGLLCIELQKGDSSKHIVVIVSVLAGLLFLIIITFVGFWIYRKRRRKSRNDSLQNTQNSEGLQIANDTHEGYHEMEEGLMVTSKQSVQDKVKSSIRKSKHITKKDTDKQIDLDSEYVELEFIKTFFEDTMTEASSCKDSEFPSIMSGTSKQETLDPNNMITKTDSGDTILLLGKAGIGKSTTVQKLLRGWASNDWVQWCDLVFCIDLHNINFNDRRLYSLHGFLERFSIFEIKIPDDWSPNDYENIIISLDTIDEFPNLTSKYEKIKKVDESERAEVSEWIINILRKDVLAKCTLILSSRHISGLKSLRIGKTIEIKGISEQSIPQFVDVHVGTGDRDSIKSIFQHNKVLLSVASITFFTMNLCQALASDLADPTKHLKTYTRIICFLILNFMNRDLNEVNNYEDENQPLLQNKACLAPLAKMAYLALHKDGPYSDSKTLVFCKEDLKNAGLTGHSLEHALQTGLLIGQSHGEYVNFPDDEVRSTVEDQYEFLHQSIQDLLSIAYLLTQDSENLEGTLKRMFKHNRRTVAEKYLFGLTFDEGSENIKHILNGVSGQDTTPALKENLRAILEKEVSAVQSMRRHGIYLTIRLVYESQDPSLAKAIVQIMFGANGEMKFRDISLTAVDLDAVFFMLSQSQNIHKIRFERTKIDKTTLSHLGTCLKSDKQLREISFEGTELCDGGLNSLKDIRENTTLERLCLKSTLIDDDDMSNLADYLKQNRSLCQLSIARNNFTEKGLEAISEAICLNNTLKRLEFDSGNVVLNNIELFTTALGKNDDLTLVLEAKQGKIGQIKYMLRNLPNILERIDFKET